MIHIGTTESIPLTVYQRDRSPCVYLDQCVLFDLATDSRCKKQAERFLQAMQVKQGTLYLSLAHIIETSSLDPKGGTYLKLCNFLRVLGLQWVLLEMNPAEVIRKEKRFSVDAVPPHHNQKLFEELFVRWNALVLPTSDLVVSDFHQHLILIAKYKQLHKDHNNEMKRIFNKARNDYRNNCDVKKRLNRQSYQWRNECPPTDFIYNSLIRETIRTNEVFRDNDGPDFDHAVVSMAYSDFVVLDKKWTRRLRFIGMPPTASKLYSVIEIDEFLNALEKY